MSDIDVLLLLIPAYVAIPEDQKHVYHKCYLSRLKLISKAWIFISVNVTLCPFYDGFLEVDDTGDQIMNGRACQQLRHPGEN